MDKYSERREQKQQTGWIDFAEPHLILYKYSNYSPFPDFIGQKILYRQMNENGLEQRLTVTFSFKYRKYPRHVRQHSPLYYYQRAHLPIKRGKFRPAKKPAGILRGKKAFRFPRWQEPESFYTKYHIKYYSIGRFFNSSRILSQAFCWAGAPSFLMLARNME